jgi:phosphonopyruvate decarboxylase
VRPIIYKYPESLRGGLNWNIPEVKMSICRILRKADDLNALSFVKLLKARGYDFFAGVPCTWLKGVIASLRADSKIEYVAAPNEAAAAGIAAGAYLGGRTPAILMQNNGLANCMDVVSSLVQLYGIPLLLVVTWRGHSSEDFDEHLTVGKATKGFLKSFDVPVFAPREDTIEKHLKVASFTSRMGKGPVVFLLRKGLLE